METPAATPTPSTEAAPVAALPDLASLSPDQRQTWRETGEFPKSQAAEPAAKDKPTSQDAAPAAKSSETAPGSESGKSTQPKPQQRTKEESANRFKELSERLGNVERENQALKERLAAASGDRKTEQKPQPAPVKEETYKRLDEKKWFADNKGKTYEDYLEACLQDQATWTQKQTDKKIADALANSENQRRQREAATEMKTAVADARQRYGTEEANKIFPALDSIVGDKDIPVAVKAMLNESDVVVDLVYTLSSDAESLTKFIQLAKTNPGSAIRTLVTLENEVRSKLKTNAGGKPATERASDGKFVKKEEAATEPGPGAASAKRTEAAAAEPITRATRPTVELGGRTAAPEDPVVAAVKSGNFRAAKDAMNREYAATHKL